METLEHLIFQCNHYYHIEDDLLNSLGLKEGPNRATMETAKRLLEKWERENIGLAELARTWREKLTCISQLPGRNKP